jgi:hypothetical protein
MIDLVSKAKLLVRERDKLDNEEREAKKRCLVDSTDSSEESSNFTVISNSSVNNSSGEATSVLMTPQLPPGYSIWLDSMDAIMLSIITKEYTKPQLIQLLERERGIVSPKGNKQKIQDMARQAGLPLTYEKREVIQGWEGKPKGMEQILWE